ncbi:TonB-dependent receptor [Bacteroides sp. 519]|uniref:TonB-dependent receptor n=1 Tax=Bacteroides sp. 519 TaxID=2302937 RepID=UPI001EF2C174|nr:TonB-dependent receptor [Bacteroides sp. 519]
MKLIVLFTVVSILQLTAAQSYAQDTKITFNLTNVTLEEAIKAIESETQFVFFFNHSDIDLSQTVSLNVNRKDIKEVLKQVLRKNDYRIENNKIVVLPSRDQDDGFIKGKIVDAFGEPIIGANVLEKGTNNGTITNLDGEFILKAAPGSVLVVTFIGYTTQEVKVTSSRSYQIKLEEDAQALGEVVVVGYGIQKKVNVIGSISQVGTKELSNRSTPQLSNALAGLMPGVSVIQRSGKPGDGSGTIRVRGVGSIGSSDTDSKSDALVLIDGIPGDLNTINSDDVESISVLKDASSAAIYGSRAANGVILVTTKTGAEGKISVTYNGYVGFNEATELPEFVNSWEWADLYNKAVGREEYSAEVIRKLQDGSDPDNYANEKYLKKILGNRGFQTSHNVSINGGSQKNRYMLSFGYMSQDGIVDKNNYTRYDGRANIINELATGLKLTTRLSGTYGMRKEPNIIGGDDASGMTGIIQKAVRFPGLKPTVVSDGSFGVGPEQHGTPVSWVMSPSFFEKPVFSVNANVRLDYNPIKDLTISGIGAFKYTNGEERGFKSTHNLEGGRTLGPSWMQNTMTKTVYKTFQATADYSKTFANVHNLGVLVGYSWEEQDYSSLKGTRDNFPGNTLHELNAGSPDNQKNEGTGNQWAIQSYFGRLQYNYAERYLFESTVRYDGSSRFPKDNKFAFFPSFALGWKISEEAFIRENENMEWLSNLKLKASWGRLGNQNIGNYPYQTVYSLGQNYPFGDTYQQGAAVTTATDPRIKWEETETIDTGFEMILWRGLLSLNASYFYRKTTDILYSPSGSVSNVLGQKVSVTNTGKLKNSGWEFELGHRHRIGKVNYNINANVTYLKNELLTLGVGNVEQPNGMVGNGSDLFIGYPMQMYYGYVSDGVFLNEADIAAWHNQSSITPKPVAGDLRYKDISGPDGVPDGVVDAKYDRVYLGSRIPKYSYGINLGAQYKDFDISLFFQGVSGVKGLLNNYAGYALWSNNGNIQRWQADGAFDPENPTRYPKYPRLESLSNTGSPNTVSSDYWIRNASYLRLKNLQIGYKLPITLVNRIGVKNIRIYAQGENLFSINNYPEGWDPEINTGGDYYPILRTITFGINLNF